MESKIYKTDHYLPAKILSNSELEIHFPEWNADKIETKIGVRERHIAADNETALDLAEQASIRVLEGYDRSKIDFLLLCTQSPDYFLPSTSCILQDRLGLNKSCGALDFNLGCSGYIYGLALAKGLISSSVAKQVLLVTSETYSKYIHPEDKGNLSIFGDGAAATIVTSSEEKGIGNFVLGTDGSGYKHLIVPNGSARSPVVEHASDTPLENSGNHLFMDGSEIFSFTIDVIPALVQDTLRANNLKAEEVDYYLFHQANTFILNYLRDILDIPEEKFYIDMLHTGNTVSASIPIALANSLSQGKIKKGDIAMLVGFGVGLSWGACVVRI
jgi:3-oxoacyl-[acyl-carrier-protein] synthase-3